MGLDGEEMRNAYTLLSGSIKEDFEDAGVDARIILKSTTKKCDVKVFIEFLWLRIIHRGGLLPTNLQA